MMDTNLRFKDELKGVLSVLKPAVPSVDAARASAVVAHTECVLCTVHVCVIKCGFSVCFMDTLMHQQARANVLL